ncbi:MAG: DNRLRE domain-containing protein, partial [Clostridia bacterium]|nr:DNRLRE domain-containing protein [Clostridia bacterium]
TYLKFDLSSIPKGSIITSATLSLYSYDADMNWQASVALVARRVTSSWDQTTITHNSQPSNTSTSQASGTFSGYNKWYDFDAKSLVQSIVNNTNYGIVVLFTVETSFPS